MCLPPLPTDVTMAVEDAEQQIDSTFKPAVKAFPRVAIDLATTVERAQQNFVICDPKLPDCPIVFASDQFLDLTGYAREEVLGRNCRFLQGADTDRAAVDQIREAINSHKELTVKILNYTKQGKPFWNLFTLAPIQDIDGTVRFFVGVQVDVTDKEAQKAWEAQQEVLAIQSAVRDLQVGGGADPWASIPVGERPAPRAPCMLVGRCPRANTAPVLL